MSTGFLTVHKTYITEFFKFSLLGLFTIFSAKKSLEGEKLHLKIRIIKAVWRGCWVIQVGHISKRNRSVPIKNKSAPQKVELCPQTDDQDRHRPVAIKEIDP